MFRIGPPQKRDKSGLAGDLETAIESMKRVPWTALSDLKGDPDILKKIDDAEALLNHCARRSNRERWQPREKRQKFQRYVENGILSPNHSGSASPHPEIRG
jgi:ParB family chromosome partitioning protein